MIFITFDPYNDYQYTYNYHLSDSSSNFFIKNPDVSIETECFICMENQINNEKTIYLNKQLFYLKSCQCNGNIHKECLDKWVTLHNNCPICRIHMVKNENLIIKCIDSNFYLILIYFFLKKNLFRIKKVFLFILFYIFFNIIFGNKNKLF
jgi:hypothetical protein